MTPDVVMKTVRAELESANVKMRRNAAELKRLDGERAEYAEAIELLNSQIAQMESWLERETANTPLQPIAPKTY